MDKLGLIIQAKLDTSQKAIENINVQIKQLEQKINKLNLKVNIDVQELKNVILEIKNTQSKISKAFQIDDSNIDKVTQKWVKVRDEQEKLKEVITQTTTATGNQIKIIDKYDEKGQEIQQTISQFTNNLKKQREQQKALVGTFDELKREQLEAIDVARVLSKQYGDLEVREYSLNKVTGQYSVVLRKSATENLHLKGTLDQASGSLWKYSETVKQARAVQLGFSEQLKIALERVPIWLAATTVWFQSFRFFRQLVVDITEVNRAMIELRKVSEDSEQALNRFKLLAPALGKELGSLATEIINVTADISKLGYTLEDALELSRLAIIGKVVGDLESVGNSVDYIISTLKGFKMEVSEASTVLDYMNYIANTTSIDFRNIGEGYKRMSSALAEANNTLQEATGLLVAGYDVTRDAERTATALRTISMRLRGVSEEGEDLSNLVPKLEGLFNRFGLTLKKNDTTLKSTFEIFRDLSAIWDKISDMERAAVLEAIAGKRNAQIAAAVIRNFQTAIDVVNKFQESQGSALLEHKEYMQSVDAAYNELQNTLTELNQKLLDSSTIITTINIANWALENVVALGKFNYAVVGLELALGFLAITNRKVIASMQALEITATAGGLRKFWSDIVLCTKALLGFDVSLKGVQVSAVALNTALAGLLVGIPLLVTAIGALINHSKRVREEFAELAREVDFTMKEIERVELLTQKLEEGNLTREEELRIQKEIAQLLPEATDKYTEQNEALATQVDIIRELNRQKLDNTIAKATSYVAQYSNQIEKLAKRYENAKKRRDELVQALTDSDVKLYTYDIRTGLERVMTRQDIKRELDEYIKQIDDLQPIITAWNNNVDILNKYLGTNYEKIQLNVRTIKESANAKKEEIDVTEDWLELQKKLVYTNKDLAEQGKEVYDNLKLLFDVESELNQEGQLSLETINNLVEKYPDFVEVIGLSNNAIKELIETKKKDALVTIETSITTTQQIVEDAKDRITVLNKEMEALIKRQEIYMSWSSIIDKKRISSEIEELQQFVTENESRIKYLEYLKNTLSKPASFVTDSKTSGSTKEYVSKLDLTYRQLQMALESVNHELDLLRAKEQQLEGKELIDNYRQQNELIHKRIILLQNFNDQYEKDITTLKKQLSDLGFDYDNLGNQIDKYNKLKDEEKEKVDNLVQSIDDLSDKYRKNSLEILNSINMIKDLNIETSSFVTEIERNVMKTVDEIANALKKKYTEMKNEALTKAKETYEARIEYLDKEKEKVEDNINEQIELLEKSTDTQIEILQRQIEEINRALSDVEYYDEIAELEEQRAILLKEYAMLEIDTSEWAKKRRRDILEEVATIEQTITEKTRRQQAEEQKRVLKDEIDNIKKQAEEKKQQLEEELQRQRDYFERARIIAKENYDKEVADINEKYDELLTAKNRYIEAEKKLEEKRMDEIIDLLESYDSEWQKVGELLGKSFKEELIKEIEEAIRETSKLINLVKTSNSTDISGGRSVTEIEEDIERRSQQWWDYYNKHPELHSSPTPTYDDPYLRKLHEENERDRELLKELRGYREGGIVDYTGLAVVHGTKQKPEGFLNNEQLETIRKLVVEIPKVENLFSHIRFNVPDMLRNINVDKAVNIEQQNNYIVDPSIDIRQMSNDIGRYTRNQLLKVGVTA